MRLCLAARLSRRVGGVPRALRFLLPGRGGCSGWLSGREGLQAADRGGDVVCPGPSFGEPQPQAAAAAHEPSGHGEQAQPEPFGFPAAGGPGQGDHLGPGQQLAGKLDDLAPDLVLRGSFERQVPQPGVLSAADPVLAPCPAAVPQFQVRELALLRAGGEGGEPVPVDIGEPQLRRPGAGVPSGRLRAFRRPVAEVQHARDVRDPGARADLPVPVIGRRPRRGGNLQDRGLHVVGDGHADRVVQPP